MCVCVRACVRACVRDCVLKVYYYVVYVILIALLCCQLFLKLLFSIKEYFLLVPGNLYRDVGVTAHAQGKVCPKMHMHPVRALSKPVTTMSVVGRVLLVLSYAYSKQPIFGLTHEWFGELHPHSIGMIRQVDLICIFFR